MTDEQACQTPLSDLRKDALAHYDAASTAAREWHSVIPRAINFYFDAQEAASAVPAGEATTPAPVAWIIPGDDNARFDGWLDARAWQEGEFTKPLYATAPQALPTRSEVEQKFEFAVETAINAYDAAFDRSDTRYAALADRRDEAKSALLALIPTTEDR